MEKLRYPIGKFLLRERGDSPVELREGQGDRDADVAAIGDFPKQFAAAAQKLKSRALLDTPYRPGGWTARQVIHHVADSHANAYVRHKRTLTEDYPTLTPYDEQRWAELADVQAVPIQTSLDLLAALHLRWATLLATLSEEQWGRTCYHPGRELTFKLSQLTEQYVWHGRHHLGHLNIVLDAA